MTALKIHQGEVLPAETDGEAALRAIEEELTALQRSMVQDEAALAPVRNSMLQRAMDIGDLLNQAKKLLGHGKFGAWRDEHFEGGTVQALKYMRFAENRATLESKVQLTELLGIEEADKMIREQKRLPPAGSQSARVLDRLKEGPSTAKELAAIAPNYKARISDLRNKHGINVVCSSEGVYAIDPGTPKKKISAAERCLAIFSKLPTAAKHATARKINADPEVAKVRAKKSLLEARRNLPIAEYVNEELSECEMSLQKLFGEMQGRSSSWLGKVSEDDLKEYLRLAKLIAMRAGEIEKRTKEKLKHVHA